MAKRENILPYAPLGSIIHEATGKRVSKDAKKISGQLMEDLTEQVVRRANLIAEHSGRKTVRGKDILLAYSQLKR